MSNLDGKFKIGGFYSFKVFSGIVVFQVINIDNDTITVISNQLFDESVTMEHIAIKGDSLAINGSIEATKLEIRNFLNILEQKLS